jgi:hypothetical protein
VSRPPELVVVLSGMPDVISALLRDHTADERGLCRECGRAGTGTPHVEWPCPLARIAESAAHLRAGKGR